MNQQTLSNFLAAFFPDEHEAIHFRAFAPKKAPGKDTRFTARTIVTTRHILVTDEALQGQLCQLNVTRGVYFVVNTGGETDAAITRLNAWFAEDDSRTIEEQHSRLDAAPIRPSIRIETRKSVHAYWLIKGKCDVTDWRDMQQRLIVYFGGDEKIKNPSRVMRLPFFNHVQYDQQSEELTYKKVKLTEFTPERRHTISEMQAAFPPVISNGNKAVSKDYGSPDVVRFTSWSTLNDEVGKRIRNLPGVRADQNGWTHAPGICHGSVDGTALYVSPDGAYGCHKGCSGEAIRTALELPIQPPRPEIAKEEKKAQKDEDSCLSIVCMADVQPETVNWLWFPYIAYGKLTILEGDPGLGKSFMTCALASAVSHGKGLPESEPFEPGNVLLLSAEDGLGDTLRPRLDAVGANVSRVFALAESVTFDELGLIQLEDAILTHRAALVIIDPLFAYTGSKIDIHRANECRSILAPLAAIAGRCGCAMLTVRHLGKARGGGHALNAGIGSIDFAAAARSVLLVGADLDDPARRAMVQIKNNLAPQGPSIGYTLEEGCFYWTGISDLTAARILAATMNEEVRGNITEAMDFLKMSLSKGARDNKEVKDEAKQAGISEATLRRAKQQLKIRAIKVGAPNSEAQQWMWELP